MKTLVSCLLLAVSLFVSAAYAACELPALVAAIPDGTQASEEDLLAAQVEVQAYIAEMDDFIACQNEEMTASGENASAEYLYLMSTRIESAREEVDQIASDFNNQVNAFRAARQAAAAIR